jgi:hypothetical protein
LTLCVDLHGAYANPELGEPAIRARDSVNPTDYH